jgi:hypothetical protein
LSTQEDAKDVDVHRIITTSFNVELNRFIANFEPKKAYFEVIRTGGLTEIRVDSSGGNIFNYYAYRLKDFREDIFLRSVKWKFPLNSFISEMDSLVDFYNDILMYTHKYDFSEKENSILDEQLVQPLKIFLLSLDREFNSNYFYQKIKNLKRKYIKKMYTLDMRVLNHVKKPVKKVETKIFKYDDSGSKHLLDILKTDKYGNVISKLSEGKYEAEIEKYQLIRAFTLDENTKPIVFTLPKGKHWWQS